MAFLRHLKHGFSANISFTFQAIQNVYALNTNLCYRVFCNFFGDFWVHLGGDSFS